MPAAHLLLPVHNVPQPGFLLAPLLYLIALAGVAGGVLFTGYTQVLQSSGEITASNAVKNELQLGSEVIAAHAILSDTAPYTLQPPAAEPLPATGTNDYKRLPKTAAGVTITSVDLNIGSADSAGLTPLTAGIKRIDPWGRLFIYCQWNGQQSPGTGPSFVLISAGRDGRLETTCQNTVAAANSDDQLQFLTVASAMARARTWQAQAGNTFRFGVDANSATAGRVVVGVDSAHDTDTTQQLNIGGNGKFGGDLTVAGRVTMTGVNAASIASSGNQTLGGKLDIAGAITNTGTTNSGTVAVHDGLYAYDESGAGKAVKMLGNGTAAQPEIGAFAATGNVPIRVSGQGSGNVILRSGGTDQLVVSSTGVGIGTTTPSALLDVSGSLRVLSLLNLSDARLKQDVTAIGDPIAQIRRLRGVRFIWKKDGSSSVGVIAQEVEAVFPELVTTGRDGIKAVMYANLVAPLIEAVKALADRQDTTDQSLAQLQAELKSLQVHNALLEERLRQLEVR